MSFDLRRATPARPTVLPRVLLGLGAAFVLLAVLVTTGATRGLDEAVTEAAYRFSAPRPAKAKHASGRRSAGRRDRSAPAPAPRAPRRSRRPTRAPE